MTRGLESGAIIVVDDDALDRMTARRCFQRSSLTNPLLELSSGEELLAYMEQVRAGEAEMPALVLLDINMGYMSGFQALQQIRSDPSFKEEPKVIMLSNSDALQDRRTAAECGAAGLVTKPSSMKAFVSFFDSLSR